MGRVLYLACVSAVAATDRGPSFGNAALGAELFDYFGLFEAIS